MARTATNPVNAYQRTFSDIVRQQLKPARLLALAVVRKLKSQGINASYHVDSLERSLAASLDKDGSDGKLKVQFETGDAAIDNADVSLSVDDADVQRAMKDVSEAVTASVPELMERLYESAMRRVVKDPGERLLYLQSQREDFNRRLALRWKRPFELLSIQVALTFELGEGLNESLRRKRRRSKNLVVADVLTRLHARACQVACEVETLLRNGFADGALSRWRTLHELAVVALFIKQESPEVAERYLLHVNIDSLKAAKQYAHFAPLLGYASVPKRDMARLQRVAHVLEKRFGKPFLGEYGWAAGALKNRSPSFSQIEGAVDLDRLLPYFKLASNTVHAGPKGAVFRVGSIRTEREVLLAGASNAGLDEAGRLTALSLCQMTACLLMVEPTVDSYVWLKVLLTLSERVEGEFIKVQRRLEREEKKRGAIGTTKSARPN